MVIGQKRKTLRKSCPRASLPITNLTRTDLDTNPRLCCENPATNSLTYGTTYYHVVNPEEKKFHDRKTLPNSSASLLQKSRVRFSARRLDTYRATFVVFLTLLEQRISTTYDRFHPHSFHFSIIVLSDDISPMELTQCH
jgi:hypothetical protein